MTSVLPTIDGSRLGVVGCTVTVYPAKLFVVTRMVTGEAVVTTAPARRSA